MSFNNLKLGLLLKLLSNHYSKDCSYQHCTYDCHHYKLLQINSTNKKKRKTHLKTRLHSPIRRTYGERLKEKTTENQEDLFQ